MMSKKFIIKRIMHKLGVEVCLTNIYNTHYSKNCLISYIQDPFFTKKNNQIHQSNSQVLVIAEVLNQLKYNVDVIDYRAHQLKLKKQYDLVIDICISDGIAVYENNLKENFKKIAYLTGSESTFANKAELTRIHDVYLRRGKRLQPRRQAPLVSKAIENCDLVILFGNETVLSTYRDFHFKKYLLIPNTGYDFKYPYTFEKKQQDAFLFLGSSGCVHKGLDILLEVFSENPSIGTLYVCGCYEREKDFLDEYYMELYKTDNIHPIGFIDIFSDKFKQLYEKCTFTVLPSCAEGCAGSLTTCMSAGLIPICSKICGFEEDEVIILPDCSKDTVLKTLIYAKEMRPEELIEKSRKMVELTKTKYSIKNYTSLIKKSLGEIIDYDE